MIDDFIVFTKTGVVLFRWELKLAKDPVDKFIKTVLLQEQNDDSASTQVDNYKLKCKIRNDLELVFVLIYQGILQMAYLDRLLQQVSAAFANTLDPNCDRLDWRFRDDFKLEFERIKLEFDREWLTKKTEMRSFADTERGKRVGVSDGADKKESEESEDGAASGRRGKREWVGAGKVNKQAIDKLDFSKSGDGKDEASEESQNAAALAQFLDDDDDGEPEINQKPVLIEPVDDTAPNSIWGKLSSKMKGFTGGKKLTEDDLAPLLAPIRDQLLNKNVAKEVADRLLESVRQSLVGQTTEAWTTIRQTIYREMVRAISQLLTPKKSVDVMRAALQAKAAGRPFSIAFIGVNGVGKSTNLAKVAYHLKKQGGLSILIAACDTFRAGAVEQLKTHARCLDAQLYERGYGKDPAEIAKNALKHAAKENIDVVLIDTAGRMQGNEPLMREISKMVAVNQPDLVLFVGEALTGNDGIDQVKQFNRSLIDLSPDRVNPRGIDGLLLTKYDTVDDKVGAALSMVYVSGQPVVFVGTGQKYTNLRKLHVEDVCNALLSR
ncbi:unnamed protein product [Amoebophrya sp. A120]|nr:unnamed protein product [Amoebophrya sp. A120]|eukprot:GSA120T00010395001.1